MNLLNIQEEVTNANLPKFSDTAFTLRNNYYVVFNGEIYNYYPIKTFDSAEGSPLIRIERNPPVILEGYAIVGRKIYLVTLKDLQRKVIRKNREIKRETVNAIDSTSTGVNAKSVSTLLGDSQSSTVPGVDKQGAGDALTVEIIKAADATWQDQIGALLSDPYEEEELWEIEDSA